jgi:hypothetical protein
MMTTYPTIVASSVIRSTQEGESHGGVYLVDLDQCTAGQVLDWDDRDITWVGRGAERGLRGIAFWNERIYLAASDAILVFTPNWDLVNTYRNRYLSHCHEIFVRGNSLLLTSTGYDSVLEMDLVSGQFVKGYCLRRNNVHKYLLRRLGRVADPLRRIPPRLWLFDPNDINGPPAGDTVHLNSVSYLADRIYVAGTRVRSLLAILDDQLVPFASIPWGTHNARPFEKGVLLNHTGDDCLAYLRRDGTPIERFNIPRYPEEKLLMAHLPQDHARQAFGRGLATTPDGLIIAGSSPATISAYRRGSPKPVRTVNITMDVRNAIHGLALWPY